MKIAVTINEQGDLILADPDETGMFIEVDDMYETALADAPIGTPIRIVDTQD